MNNGVFTKSEELTALLIAGGLPENEVNDFVAFVYAPSYEQAIDEVMAYRLGIVAESLSPHWIIENLRTIADGNDKVAAVAALDVLQRMNRELFNPEFLFKKRG
ncbi:TPA: hypothetical protein JXT23_004526 [Escherichia coli]|nr:MULTISPECIES: hypothetical protein [Escherichia]EAB1830277.1 hypothetical protein [Salmonella enterica]EAM6834390.1 hypothetical protein [Salmonella enterica subsp. enterica serovar Adelaide]ECG2844464.1 hypothetical protein [Salmonella enterica subsp. enterica serovar Manhattan]EDB2642671.1 hypothetical protein [Salmonella enterica subsp. enterica]EDP8598034.1 hypothetical protein [Salmonella bongori]EEZ5658691.1 hypothetical protein [Escherichia coli O5]EGU9840532.1 hypothetical protein